MSGHFPVFFGAVQDQKQQFQGGVVVGKMPSGADGAPEFRVQGLYGVGRIDQPAFNARPGTTSRSRLLSTKARVKTKDRENRGAGNPSRYFAIDIMSP
jgi:hypothetical protein